jgi:1-acyl-sn-glycerol-3-phosphate acyltransferase
MFKEIALRIYSVWLVFIFFCIMVPMFPLIVIPILVLGDKRGGAVGYFFLKIWAVLLGIFYMVIYKFYNRESIDRSKAHIYISNHNSFFDSVTLMLGIPGQFRPLGKVEITKAPIFGYIYSKIVVTVDRKSIANRQKSILQLIQKLKMGISVLIYPEGAMNETTNNLTNFHDGAFLIAIESQTPIIPVVLINSRYVMPKLSYLLVRPGIIRTYFADAISTQGLTKQDLPALREKVYGIMNDLIEKHK